MKHTGDYLCRIDLRVKFNGCAVKPGARVLEGRVCNLMSGWRMGKFEKYPGEWAMVPADENAWRLFNRAGVSWIASGDVRDVRQAGKCSGPIVPQTPAR